MVNCTIFWIEEDYVLLLYQLKLKVLKMVTSIRWFTIFKSEQKIKYIFSHKVTRTDMAYK